MPKSVACIIERGSAKIVPEAGRILLSCYRRLARSCCNAGLLRPRVRLAREETEEKLHRLALEARRPVNTPVM